MSAATSPGTGLAYGLQRVCAAWGFARSSFYAMKSRQQATAERPPAKRRGPKPSISDEALLVAIEADLEASPWEGEGHRKVWARLRVCRGIRVSRKRVLRVMRENNLLSPHRCRRRGGNPHVGEIITHAPNLMWGTDGVRVFTVDDGWGWIFTAIEHWNAECVGWHVCKRGDRFAALQPISMGLARLYASTSAGAARGLALRMDHGSQYLSDHFTNQIKFWGIQPSYAFVEQPQTNGVAERFNRTLKEQIIHGRIYRNIAELRNAVRGFVEQYNAQWIVEKNGYLSPRSSSSGVAHRDVTQARRMRQTCVQGTGCDTLVLQFRDTAAAKLSSFAILERVLRDQFEIVDDEYGDRDAKRAAIRDPKDVPCDTVGNPADPDAGYNAHKGQGYMAQIVETYCEDVSNEAVAATPDLITHVEVHKMTVHDGHRLADALDDLSERALTPAVMLGDSHYGSSDNMALTREQNINLVAPARPPKGAVSGRLTLEDFTLNEEGLVLRCPNNVEPVSASLAKAKLQARFDLSICQKCPDILRCPVQAAKRDGQFSRFQYTPARAANQKRRLYEQSDAFRNVYRWRAGIEATMSRLKYQMNLAHLRIRGMPAMRYVVNLRALGLNIRRCAAIAP